MSKQTLAPNTIGASQAAAACGAHPYQPRITLWQTLRGELPPFEGNAATEWGNRLEGAVRDRYEEDHGCQVWVPKASLCGLEKELCFGMENPADSKCPVYGPEYEPDGYQCRQDVDCHYTQVAPSWARATPDGIVVDADSLFHIDTRFVSNRWLHGLEIKTTGSRNAHRWGESGSDIYPIEYRYQLAWSCWVCDLPRWDLAVLIGGQEYREYTYMRDPDFEMVMVTYAERFWREHVLTGTPPPPDDSKEYKDFLGSKHPEPDGVIAEERVTASNLAEMIHWFRNDIKESKEVLQQHENELLAIIGDNLGIKVPGGVVKWTKRKGGTQWKAVAECLYNLVDWAETDQTLDGLKELHKGKDSRTPYYPRNWTIPGGDTNDE